MVDLYTKPPVDVIEFTEEYHHDSSAVRRLLLDANKDRLYFVFHNNTVSTRSFIHGFEALANTINDNYDGSVGRYWNDRRLDADMDDVTFTASPSTEYRLVPNTDEVEVADAKAADEVNLRDITRATLVPDSDGVKITLYFGNIVENFMRIDTTVKDLHVLQRSDSAFTYDVGVGSFILNVNEVVVKQ